MSGVRRTAEMPQLFNRHPRTGARQATGLQDPGAAAAQTLLTGLVLAFIGDRVARPAANSSNANRVQALLQRGIDLGSAVTREPEGSPVEQMLGATGRARNYGQPLEASRAGDRVPEDRARR